MTFTFRPAKREQIGLLIGLAGGTGSGKTYSAFELATGIAEATGKPFVVIDTEARRALHYADQFEFQHGDLGPPFTPARYTEAILAADALGPSAIVVDSASHLWAGDGGVLDMQEHEFARMGGRDAVKMASWIKPKGEHRKFVTKLLQLRAHLILCFRAEQKVEMKKGRDGKMEVVPKESLTGLDGWIPICEKNLPFELTTSFLLTAKNPGVPLPIKLEAQHRAIFPEGEKIDRAAGRRLAEWAAGGVERPVDTPRSKIEATLAAFQAIGVTAPKLEEEIGHPLTEDDLPALRKLYGSLMRRAQEAAKPPPPADPSPDDSEPETGF